MMNHSHGFIALGITLVICLLLIGRLRRRLKRKRDQLRAFEDEEARMFDYLHDLGEAIGRESGQLGLYRVIVEGVTRVVNSRGGAVYLLDDTGEFLQPKHISENCPPLVGVPPEVIKRAEKDPRVMESHVRLAQESISQGVLGNVLQAGQATQVEDLKSHEAFRDAFHGFGGGEVAALIAPLRHSGKDLGVLAVARGEDDPEFSPNDFSVFRSAAEQSAFALGNALLYREAAEKRMIESDLRSASEVQRILLPQGDPIIPGYRVAGTNLPARIISGDYYDHLQLADGSHGVVIADVSGKGVAAGIMMAMCRSVLRAEADSSSDPGEVLAIVNRQLFSDMREDMFISLFYGVISPDGSRMQLVRAGHETALCYRCATRKVEKIRPPGLAIGVDDGPAFERVTRPMDFEMESGDCLLFYTDGVKEAVDANEQEFGMKRLEDTFLSAAPFGAEAVMTAIRREVEAFAGGGPQMDDITLLVLERR
ncbi:sigma-B regulation protein RsbU (phosphoserine phosphatase) [Haloferula luteola]|uniref:Sigma-B regulation protein RsbU (Phosphoserine phosphatase) n=1 Tax=Haloferula luteola TaxID=595692 RepID=A0A840UZU2_9BACT|nr:GAF domain-containing SpoIIE family protein phosphatase [Haloferula luteola]MBB5350523.1 sigma-B regulation protein RsbU (phosphoserine phosphatase) [Haloferula luteola]